MVLLFAVAGTVFPVFQTNRRDQNKSNVVKQNEENYFSLSASDQETADLYAELYEMSREDVAEQQVKTLEEKSLAKEERVEVAILIMNEAYTFGEVIEKLDAGKTVGELKKKPVN